jgi:hypothetical protein
LNRELKRTIKQRAKQFVADNPPYFLGLSKKEAHLLAESLIMIGASIVYTAQAEASLAELDS